VVRYACPQDCERFYFDALPWLPSLHDAQAVALFARFLPRMLAASGVLLQYDQALGRQYGYLTLDASGKEEPNRRSPQQDDILPIFPPKSVASHVNNSLVPETGTTRITRGFSRHYIVSARRPHAQLATRAILHAERTKNVAKSTLDWSSSGGGDGGGGACSLGSRVLDGYEKSRK